MKIISAAALTAAVLVAASGSPALAWSTGGGDHSRDDGREKTEYSWLRKETSGDDREKHFFSRENSYDKDGCQSFCQTHVKDDCVPDTTNNNTPVPLPAAGWLLVGAFGGLGTLRRMRKA